MLIVDVNELFVDREVFEVRANNQNDVIAFQLFCDEYVNIKRIVLVIC